MGIGQRSQETIRALALRRAAPHTPSARRRVPLTKFDPASSRGRPALMKKTFSPLADSGAPLPRLPLGGERARMDPKAFAREPSSARRAPFARPVGEAARSSPRRPPPQSESATSGGFAKIPPGANAKARSSRPEPPGPPPLGACYNASSKGPKGSRSAARARDLGAFPTSLLPPLPSL
jgi:hypothetical protein